METHQHYRKKGNNLEAALRQQRWPEQSQSLLMGLFLTLYIPVSIEITIHDYSRAHMELLPCPSHTNYQLQPIHLHSHGGSSTWRNLFLVFPPYKGVN